MTRGRRRGDSQGFTLIEVVGALVVFSMGVLLVLNLSGALSTQLNQSALRSTVIVEVQEALDSMAVEPYESLAVGTVQESIYIRGSLYSLTKSVTQTHPMMRQVTVSVQPLSGSGPSHSASTIVVQRW